MHPRFHHAEKITLKVDGEEDEVIDLKYEGNGYVHEISEVNRCVLNAQTESEKHSHARSIELSELLDRVKDGIGLSY